MAGDAMKTGNGLPQRISSGLNAKLQVRTDSRSRFPVFREVIQNRRSASIPVFGWTRESVRGGLLALVAGGCLVENLFPDQPGIRCDMSPSALAGTPGEGSSSRTFRRSAVNCAAPSASNWARQ